MPTNTPKYSKCPTCGNTNGSFVYKCNSCGKIYCGYCGNYNSCPNCKSSNTKQLGELGKPYYEP